MKKKAAFILKLAVPAAILTYLFSKIDIRSTGNILTTVDPWIFLVSFLILCFRNGIGAYRSKVLLDYKKLDFSLVSLVKYYFIGNFFALFLPEVVGRDLARGYYLYNSSEGKTEAIGSIVVERFIGTVALMLLTLLSVGMAVSMGIGIISNDIIKVISITFSAGCVVMALFFYERTDRFLESLMPESARTKVHTAIEFIRDIVSYNKSPKVIWYTLFISGIFQLTGVIATYMIALSLGTSMDFVYFLVFLPVIWLVGMIPVSINGLGVREGSFVLLFGSAGMAEELALAICILWFIQNIGLGIIGGILFLFGGKDGMRKKQ